MYKSLLVTDSVNVLARFGFAHIAGLARVKRFNSSGHRVHTVINCLLPLLACRVYLLLLCVFVYCDDFHIVIVIRIWGLSSFTSDYYLGAVGPDIEYSKVNPS